MPPKFPPNTLRRTLPAPPHNRHSFLRAPSRIFPSRSRSYSHCVCILPSAPAPTPPPHSIGTSPAIRRLTSVPGFLPRQVPTMSSAPAKKEFLCILPDFPGAQAKRLEVRPSHLEGVKPLVAAGSIVAGGAMLESHPAEGETPAFKGSMMLALASDEAEVRAILENDIYAHSGVWDLSKAQIIPFKSAVRKEL